MRVFFSIDPDENIQHACSDIVKHHRTKKALHDVRWSEPNNRHLTIRFLAEVDEEKLNGICDDFAASLESLQPFPIITRFLLLMPPRRPRIFAMLLQLTQDLASLVRCINDATELAGFKNERRPFLPHITIARFKNPLLGEQFDCHLDQSIVQVVREVVLYRSEPTDHGSKYTVLRRFELNEE